jgi:hypothetical protein
VVGPAWLRWVFAAAFLAVAGYCVLRLVAAQRAPAAYRGCHRAVDMAHLLLGAGMAVMCSPVGGPVPAAGWQTVFLLVAAWFLGSALHRVRTGAPLEPIGWHGGGVHHAVAAVAMLYMLTGMPHDTGHMTLPWLTGMSSWDTGIPVVGWLFAAYFAGQAVLLAPRTLRAAAPTSVPGILAAPRVTAACQVIMAAGMGYLIVPIT